jgi:hypothetical protein
MPRKTFLVNEVLTAGDVNTFLMNQSVQTYAGTAARSTALGTATVEGQLTYLEDTNRLELLIGTATFRGMNGRTVTASSAETITISSLDNNTLIYSVGTPTITVPDVLAVGDSFEVIRGAGIVTFAAGTGVNTWAGVGTAGTAGSGLTFKIDQQYNGAQVIKVADNSYTVIGKISV